MYESMNLVWATDENYAFLAGVSITSVMESKKEDEFFHIWILADRISRESEDGFSRLATKYGFQLTIVDMEDLLNIIRKTGARAWGDNESLSAYSRLFIAQLLKEKNVKRVLYCDCDLIIDGSLKEVYNVNLGDKVIGMVRNYDRLEIRDLVGLSYSDPYYNSGFMLLDVDKWIENSCTERIMEHMNMIRASYPFVDQDLINCVLKEEIMDLSMKYNVNPRIMQYTYSQLKRIYGMNEQNYFTEEEYNSVHNGDIVVYHCSDPSAGKPWEIGNKHIFSNKWRFYYDKSLWNNQQLTKYNPNKLSKISSYLERLLPSNLFVVLLSFSAKFMMKKVVKKYM